MFFKTVEAKSKKNYVSFQFSKQCLFQIKSLDYQLLLRE